MHVAIWRYRIDPANRPGFEQAYGPQGEWTRLFALQDGYLGTELFREEPQPEEGGDSYLTIDRWRDRSDWQTFLDRHEAAYRDLDREFEALTVSEERVGAFAAVG